MLRLSLNVSSTKLIIGEGHTGTSAAGGVIEGFAMFVMGGSVFLGLVVFGVLMIVNFMVITKGAGRMAEVGARFALDGMPGKQLAIDSDMAAGAINHAEAKSRRDEEQQETTFFGALDGVSKFVKGDAVAGLLITLLNILVGLSMGIFVHDMAAGVAFETYAILTVGDGLVTQFPAVIISIATALLLSKGREQGSADQALLRQLGGYPMALATVAVLMALLAIVPGLPFGPFLLGAVLLAAASWYAHHMQSRPATIELESAIAPPEPDANLGTVLDLDELTLEFAPDLVGVVMDPAFGLDRRIVTMRVHLAEQYGIILPSVRLTDDPALPVNAYRIRVQGVAFAQDIVRPGHVLAITGPREDLPDGEDVKEPVFQVPARWVDDLHHDDLAITGIPAIHPAEVLATHFMEAVKGNLERLLSRRALRRVLEAFTEVDDPERAASNRRLLDEFIPDPVPIDTLHMVLRHLLREKISIRNLPLILEALSEALRAGIGGDAAVELVRQRLGTQITAPLKEDDGTLPLLQLGPDWEQACRRAPGRLGNRDKCRAQPGAGGSATQTPFSRARNIGKRHRCPCDLL
jgi:flagellar biosynthesis protein FlhA